MLRLLAALFSLAALSIAQPSDPLNSLRTGHPRLIARKSDIERIRSLIKTDGGARKIYDALVREGAEIEDAPTVEYKLAGPRLLAQSRRCLDRIYTLALLYRVDGKQQYLKRAIKELRAAASFPDWNPSHFLDTAEMTHAFAIGYDWLYQALSQEERRWIRNAIVEKGIDAALPIYEKQGWWTTSRYNWNQVCNGGIGIGALAIAEDQPEKSRAVLRYALKSLPIAMKSYAPDGGWAEGPGYWHYATRYTVYFLAALETALGTDFGLSSSEGFSKAGHFRIYSTGPTWKSFNYADARDSVSPAAEMFWLARKFSEPVYSWQEQQLLKRSNRAEALDLVWYQQEARTPQQAGWPLDVLYRGVQAAFLRSDWDDPKAIFVGVKGGDNEANHSHLDLGTFVLDAGGVRWAIDLGPDDYNLSEYFGDLRWTYYRLRTESHNTVLIDGENQDASAQAPVTAYAFSRDWSLVRINLSGAYSNKLKRYERSVMMVQRAHVSLSDLIEAVRPMEPLWGMVTDAEVQLKGKSAELKKDGWTLSAEIRSPDNAKFDVIPTTQSPPQAQNEGTKKLVVRLPEKVTHLSLNVVFTPYRTGEPKPRYPSDLRM